VKRLNREEFVVIGVNSTTLIVEASDFGDAKTKQTSLSVANGDFIADSALAQILAYCLFRLSCLRVTPSPRPKITSAGPVRH
jgi:hypothetical protein